MKKALTQVKKETWYFVDGKKIIGTHTGISGDVTDIVGNIDECKITETERKKGINIKNLIK